MSIVGVYKIKCMKPGGDILILYGFVAMENQEIDLLDPGLPDTIRAADFWTADNMARDTGFELGQKIRDGLWSVTEKQLGSEG